MRWWPCPVLAVLAGCIGIGIVCRHYHVYSWRGWEVYQAMHRECPPIWREFNFGGIKAGDDVESVIARTHPRTVTRRGRLTILDYGDGSFTGLVAVACDGRMTLAYAFSCAWVRVFFDEMTDDQSMEYMKCPRHDPRRFGIVPVYRSYPL